MPTSTPEARVVGVTGNIVSVESDAPLMKNAIAFVHTGDASLKGEVLRVQGRRADLILAYAATERRGCSWLRHSAMCARIANPPVPPWSNPASPTE